MSDRLLTAREVADWLDLTAETVLRYMRRGELRAIRLPGTKRGRLRFRHDDVEAWLTEHATKADDANREVSATQGVIRHDEAYSSLPSDTSATPLRNAARTEEG